MTDKERYDVLLGELAELLKQKNEDLYIKDIQIDNLKTKLAEAEKYTKPAEIKSLEIRGE